MRPRDSAKVRVERAAREERPVAQRSELLGDAFKLGPHVEAATKAVSERGFDDEVVEDANSDNARLDAGGTVGGGDDFIVPGVHFATGMTSVPM